MDAITLYQHGIKNVCALMGTRLSLRQIGLIARYCNNICMCLDSDNNQAGQKATKKNIENILSLEKLRFCDKISIIDGIPLGTDPDEFICKNGKDAFLSLEKEITQEDIEEIIKGISPND